MNMLAGLLEPTSGEIVVNGKSEKLDSPSKAASLGIGMVHQHFMLVEDVLKHISWPKSISCNITVARAEFENPVMLYSIGKDSSVMVRLAEKAFYSFKKEYNLTPAEYRKKYTSLP